MLERNSVPYSKRGAFYYNCQFGAQAMATIDDRVMGVTVGGRERERERDNGNEAKGGICLD
ncbi:hypothetical protein ACSBR1_007948 [Camellia fascicularis]